MKIIIASVLLCTLFVSCEKDNTGNQEKPKGTVSFYNLEPNQCDTINIECARQNSVITKKYTSTNAVCGGEGMYTLSLDTGVWQYTATCGTLKLERAIRIKSNECTLEGVGFAVLPSLDGIWTLDFSLETDGSNCDENLLEDEAHIPPTLSFRQNNRVWFESDPVGSDLNSFDFTNGYDYVFPNLKIWSTYNDGSDTIHLQCNLVYDSQTQKFKGTYTNQWTDGTICTNDVTLYR